MSKLTIEEIWRYPVKSLQGERIRSAEVRSTGIIGDRQWSIVDNATGKNLTARREPRLLLAAARVVGDARDADTIGVEITLPDGSVASDDDALSEWLGIGVTLTRASEDSTGHYETQADETETGDWLTWTGPAGSFHDSTRTRVSVVSRQTLRDWDSRRFRINVITDGQGEDSLVGRQLTAGTATFDVVKQIDRCVVVTRPQPAHAATAGPELPRDLSVLKTINAERASVLGLGCLVPAPGTIEVGASLGLA